MATTLDAHRANVRAIHAQLRIALKEHDDDAPIVVAIHAVLENAQRALKAEENKIIRAISGMR